MPCDHVRIPISIVLFLGSTAYMTRQQQLKKTGASKSDSKDAAPTSQHPPLPPCQVVFVLGEPGTGKGTQCQLLKERLGTKETANDADSNQKWEHLSAGDLLRAERKKTDSKWADLINSKIAAGELVPSWILVQLIEQAMAEVHFNSDTKPGSTKFLLDGFPRSLENDQAWQERMGKKHTIKFVLNFVCPEDVLIGRLLERGKTSGRVDDDIDVIRKRFATHQKETIPILKQFKEQGILVHEIQSDASVEEVYQRVATLFQ